ncbi:fructose-specific PTS transporter subunit EIIC [Megasphaera butyrica]|uniref:PTS fructose transporter subunit IIABC n=1 Tax=Megasphaera butyrica TaxID=2981791 RepID=UPI000820E3CD|nr:fructose-specific PTS transporter subunit EIIC [Megasphaera butyrica]MCU6714147.1 fructose-specific PTS transporter subunit EIIC [Megasphaera butyrica]SCH40932.1 EIIABC-Fru [uncultured Megasphaera sp.]SCJ08917.1 EIIABC-Fru [uncultured Ruminococcus sp.]
MRIVDLLKKESIDLQAVVADKGAAIDHLVSLMDKGGNVTDLEGYRKAVLAREAEGSTGIGEGIAIPHAKTDAVSAPGLASMIVRSGVEYESLDDEPAFLFFLIAAPAGGANVHLEVLSRLSRMLMDDEFREKLMNAKTADEYLAVIDETETAQLAAEAEEEAAEAEAAPADEPASPAPSDRPFVIGVTACPTGIAHTYMAAEALESKGAAMGVDIKIETNGSGGVKNHLTAEDIERAVGVIVACDKDVPTQRFAGKPVVFTKVANGIKIPEELIQTVLDGKAPIFNGESSSSEAVSLDAAEKESAGRQIYKHLMNGVSHMLPFVIGGGILIALAFLFDMEHAGTAQFGTGTPLAAFLKNIGGLAFSMMMPILAGYIAMSIGERPALMPGIVGGFLATTGGSGFFGALFAGFIAGYLIILLKKVFSNLPQALDGTKPILIYPVLGLVLIGVIMTYIINPPTALFNTWLFDVLNSMTTTSRIVLGFILGGMMSIDFGGPINKAAYVFGMASLMSASGEAISSGIMASVMIGGMVPPIAIALAMLLFKQKFTAKERQSTVTNFIMGLSFITEGAIPFAASDPVHIIPPCAVGAAVAGALSMLFHCAVPAPHGGIFVFGVVTNPLMYVAALAAGVVVAAVLMGIVRKKQSAD